MQYGITLQQIADDFQEQGFVVLPGFFSAHDCVFINEAIEQHYTPVAQEWHKLHSQAADKFACDVLGWDPCAEGSTPFLTLRAKPALHKVTAACIGEGFTVPGSLVMWAAPHGRGQSWHQDCPPENASDFNLNRLFYTQDVTLEDGAVVVVPGSHRSGRIPSGDHQEPIAGERVLTPSAGTLVLLHGHVFHRVTPNLNGKPRTSVNFRAFPQSISPGVCEVGVYRNGQTNFRTQEIVDVATR